MRQEEDRRFTDGVALNLGTIKLHIVALEKWKQERFRSLVQFMEKGMSCRTADFLQLPNNSIAFTRCKVHMADNLILSSLQ